MKKTFKNLSADKIAYIERVRDIIVSDMLRSNKGLVYVILFGSYARGNWVYERGYDEENEHNYSYVSDLDILIVTEKECSDYGKVLRAIDRKLPKVIPYVTSGQYPPVSMISHTIEHVNEMLEDNSYFFNDIKKEGIMLYDSGQYQLASPKKFSPEERKQRAIEKFDTYFGSAVAFLEESRIRELRRNIRAFMMHQACENAFVAANFVLMDDRRKIHDLEELEKKAATYEPEFLHSFPKETPRDAHIYKLICKSYIDSRYKKNFSVSEEELEEMALMVKNFHILTERLCKKAIDSFV
jgi:predicted nucleotidyltransferase/HEPN domain-containing protein